MKGCDAGSSDDECTAEELATLQELERRHVFQQSDGQLAGPLTSTVSAAAAQPLLAQSGTSRPGSGAAHPGLRIRSHPELDGQPCKAAGGERIAAACHSGSSCDSGRAGEALPQVCGFDLCMACGPVCDALTTLLIIALCWRGAVRAVKAFTILSTDDCKM